MEPFEKNYDFDMASSEWMKNKIKLGGGQYKYVCGHLTTKGKKCLRKPITSTRTCFYHDKTIFRTNKAKRNVEVEKIFSTLKRS